MSKYKVTVRRIVREDIQVEITAFSLEDAKQEAQALASMAPADKWDCYDCEYWIDDDAIVVES